MLFIYMLVFDIFLYNEVLLYDFLLNLLFSYNFNIISNIFKVMFIMCKIFMFYLVSYILPYHLDLSLSTLLLFYFIHLSINVNDKYPDYLSLLYISFILLAL